MAVKRTLILSLVGVSLFADCRVPELAPGAISRLPAAELVDSGHYLRAERELEAAGQPSDARSMWLLSRSKAALGKLDDAMTLAEAALALEPDNASYHVQIAAVAARLAEKAGLLKKLTYARRAKQELDAAAALDVKNTDAQWGLMMYFYAAPPMVGGDRTKAVQLGEQLASAVPDLGRYYQGRLASELKEVEKAEAFYKQSASENPLLFETASSLALHYMRTKPDQLRAERWACQAVHADPLRGEAWALLARAYTMCGCWAKAVDAAQKAEDADPDNLAPWFTLGEAAIERGEQLDQAPIWLTKYLNKPIEGGQPPAALAHMHLATALSKTGKTADAVQEAQKAVDLDPTLENAKGELKRLTAELKRTGEKSPQ
ncbi:MAG: Tetratricopeptide 2 repeat protein [Bryobacterales bacterium]|nr:Tetratricopeptide 2 repeat protein [Bryobacterales bacterium]